MVAKGSKMTEEQKIAHRIRIKEAMNRPEIKRKMSRIMTGKNVGTNNHFFNKKHTDESLELIKKRTKEGMIEAGYTSDVISDLTKKGMSRPEIKEKMSGENSSSWDGGSYMWWHNKAWNLFGLPFCIECGITNDEHKEILGRRLSMHCKSNPKDYTIMTDDNWACVCEIGCHQKLEEIIHDNGE